MTKNEYSITVSKRYIEQISSLSSVESYSDNRAKRQDLASLYKQVMNIGASFPKRPNTMTNFIVAQLYKKTSRTCPSCVHPERMKIYVKDAIKQLETYSVILKKWLNDDYSEDDTQDGPESKTIHDLRPNIE